MRVGIVGIGGVGKALMKLLGQRDDMELVFALKSSSGAGSNKGLDPLGIVAFLEGDKNLANYSGVGFGKWELDKVLEEYHIDLLVEATPTEKKTGEPALGTIRAAMKRGIHVVTANKGPVLLKYRELKELADGKGLGFGIGCTAGAALPTVSAGENDLLGSRILGLRGVLNGTTNYILSLMADEDLTYEEALERSKKEGIAETDPSQDVEGWDTAIKMTIIANALMGTSLTLESASVTGITHVKKEDILAARKEGKRYRLVGSLTWEDENPRVQVRPEKLHPDDIFFNVHGKNKGMEYLTDNLGVISVLGGASDVKGAAASIIRDILQIKKNI